MHMHGMMKHNIYIKMLSEISYSCYLFCGLYLAR